MQIILGKARTFFSWFLLIIVLFLSAGKNSYGWIYTTEEIPQNPVMMIDIVQMKNCPFDLYLNGKRSARITTSYILELQPDKVYHFEIRCSKEKEKLFETDMSLSLGKEVHLKCRDGRGCTIDI